MAAVKTIKFPKRRSVILEASKITIGGGSRSKAKSTTHGVRLVMENGDNFEYYSSDPLEIDYFKVGKKLGYIFEKTQEGEVVKNRLISFDFGEGAVEIEKESESTVPEPEVTQAIVKTKKTKTKPRLLVKKAKSTGYVPTIKALKGMTPLNFLFIDIETVRIEDTIKAKTALYDSWAYKVRKGDSNNAPATTAAQIKKTFEEKAALFPEFGKVVCITVGMIKNNEPVVFSYYDDDERQLLSTFAIVINKFYDEYSDLKLCGHSIIGYDIPFLMRRMLINGVSIPDVLDLSTAKPWELTDKIVDINPLWKGTAFNNASLPAISVALGIPSPKENIDGSMVSDVYYREKDGIKQIVKYCENDVFATINVMQKLYNSDIFSTFVSKTK